ncbi:hypothetical protein SHD_3909 [Shewanella decolorationis S12]|uniref:Uncharacterized protein n=1 Tax=Shewanella decolorationis S12 TaxID=1353536 RepID=A0ABN0PIA8_9GAMM|nr:hypothetical protein SHD_3909 [Shewanella decolorationis S12]GLR32774.1 hypothetical protein GCM10007922_23330 [Shewanella decolorationis]
MTFPYILFLMIFVGVLLLLAKEAQSKLGWARQSVAAQIAAGHNRINIDKLITYILRIANNEKHPHLNKPRIR